MSGKVGEVPKSQAQGRNVPDCTSCKVIGAGGCFAGGAYALYLRSKFPNTSTNRRWLAVLGIGRWWNSVLDGVF